MAHCAQFTTFGEPIATPQAVINRQVAFGSPVEQSVDKPQHHAFGMPLGRNWRFCAAMRNGALTAP